MKKILVTGGAGFIGSSFLEYMIEKYSNYNFVCLDALTYAGNFNNISHLTSKNNFIFECGDISDKNSINELFKKYKFDIVVNFAAESHVDNSIKNPDIFIKSNVLGVLNLLNACKEYGIERFHQVSTDEVYGELPLERKDLKFIETSPIIPSNPYSASKASAELLVMSYHKTFGMNVTISRCSNNYGKRQFPEKLIPMVISRALYDEPITIHGTGENIRDWIYVLDHVKAIDLIIHKGQSGKVYNVGGSCERTNLEVTKAILKYMSKPESLIQFVENRKGNDLRYAIDATFIGQELGWKRSVVFEDGIGPVIDWYINNRDWVDNIKSGKYLEDNNKILKNNK